MTKGETNNVVERLPFRAVEIVSSLTGAGLGEYRIFRGDENLGEISTKRLLEIFQSLSDRIDVLCGDINEARVHLSDLTGKGLRSVDSADELLGEALRASLTQGGKK